MSDTEQTQPRDAVAIFILDFLAGIENNSPVTHEKIAKAFWEERKKSQDKPDEWRKYLNAVKQQAVFLARQKEIDLVRRGEAVDPDNFKGLVRLRLPK